MPSKAYGNFLKNYEQVEKLKTAYEDALCQNPKRGRRNLDHFTRAAIMFLCSSFEIYFEQVLLESCSIISRNSAHPDDLPKQVKKTISKYVKNSKYELEPIVFANNWKAYYLKLVTDDMMSLNTPKMNNICEYVSKYIGLNDIFDKTTYPFLGIDDIVKERGGIAHKLYGSTYINKSILIEYCDTIKGAVKEMDIILLKELPKIIQKKPWNYTY